MGTHNHLLLVEGKDDLHVIGHILDQQQIDCQIAKKRPQPPDAPTIFLQETGGISNLLNGLKVRLNDVDLKRVGIVLDADQDINARWRSITSQLTKIGKNDLPPQPKYEGTHTTLYLQSHTIEVGIWLMPTNSQSGMLEDFVQTLIPQPDNLLTHAQHSINTLPERLFTQGKQTKAEIHTWLAWQADPGRPMGEAIKNGVLPITTESAQAFVTWIRRTFNLTF